jgi:hypothetical protein
MGRSLAPLQAFGPLDTRRVCNVPEFYFERPLGGSFFIKSLGYRL